MKSEDIITLLKGLSNQSIADKSQRYFKTAKGEYGYGDIFLGIRVPILRKHIKESPNITLEEIRKLLKSKYHEIRLFALLLLVKKFNSATNEERNKICTLYLKHTKYINNWDLVDSSAPYLIGPWLYDKDRLILYELAKSKMIWERRISILSTTYFIKNNQFDDAFDISTILLNDDEDLIHKAVGWMLREVGNRNRMAEEKYLKSRYRKMPRTMLRYAIEKFEPERRQQYLKGLV